MSQTRNSQGSHRARNHRVAFKTTRRVNAEMDVMSRCLGVTKSGAAHWACLVWGAMFTQDSVYATNALTGAVSMYGTDEDRAELIGHLAKLGIDNPPWEA
jgi:hypothetical protein